MARNVYQRILALDKSDFRIMRADLRSVDAYNTILAGYWRRISEDDKQALKRIYHKHGVHLDDDEVISAVYATLARSSQM